MTEAMRTEEMRAWLYDRALPFWAEAGIDPSGAGAWEALEHDGTPQRTRDKRLRVMPRQAFVFASAGGAYLPLARRLFDFAMARGFDPNTGHLAALLSPEGEILKAPHDLYDMAFMLLAAAALTEAGEDVAADLATLTEKLGWLKAERGWYETAEGAAKHPRRQNPHMHLFEASTELYRVTGDAAWRAIADECLSLFKEVFLQGDGRVFEFFNLDWSAAESQAVEPGHMAEWIWLLHRYEVATGESAGVDLNAVWAATLKGQDASGLLYDSSEPLSETRRLWPQTELLKASLVVGGTGDMTPERIAARLYAEYLDTEVPGGWYDKRRISDGALISTDMPSSTFYHLYVAAVAFLEAA
ncbi:MAG: AGE family epimerase/isomerase [Pseudomonadota bacterium]